jgi:hypothetical protein
VDAAIRALERPNIPSTSSIVQSWMPGGRTLSIRAGIKPTSGSLRRKLI